MEACSKVDPKLQNGQHSLAIFRFKPTRTTLKIVFVDASAADERYAGQGDRVLLEGELLRPPTKSSTVLIFMHPSGIMNLLPMPNALARAGCHVCTAVCRYPNNDAVLIMEKVVIDLGEYIKRLKAPVSAGGEGYVKVVLCGWSGGGSLSALFQSEAEQPTITHTPAGDPVDLAAAGLIPADALMLMASHTSR